MAGAVIKNHLKRTILHLSEFSIQVKVVLVIQFVRLTAQVVKEKGTLTGLNRRVILGDENAILDIIKAKGRGKSINTSYVESRNGNYRKDNKRLARKTQCHSKKVDIHDAQINWITAVYNFLSECAAFREYINPKAKRFEIKYKKFSPAMLEGLIDRLFTIEELLMIKIPAT